MDVFSISAVVLLVFLVGVAVGNVWPFKFVLNKMAQGITQSQGFQESSALLQNYGRIKALDCLGGELTGTWSYVLCGDGSIKITKGLNQIHIDSLSFITEKKGVLDVVTTFNIDCDDMEQEAAPISVHVVKI